MNKRYTLLALVGLLVAACQTQQQAVQNTEGLAIQTAVSRAQFDMNCPTATGQVLSTNVSQPEVQGRWATAYGVQRFEYTVGVKGCGQRRTYIVICPQGGGCFAAAGRN